MTPDPTFDLWVYLSEEPLLWLTLTLAAYVVGDLLATRAKGHPLVNPVLIAAGCGGPFLTIPGSELDGVSTPIPADWAFTDEVSTIQIETNPADPYSVNIWVVSLDGHLYLHAGAYRTNWVEHLESDPLLRVGIAGKLYDLQAERVLGAPEFARFADAFEAKYDQRPRNENIDEIYVYRLVAR